MSTDPCTCPECGESGESHGPTCGCQACCGDGATYFRDDRMSDGFCQVGVYAGRVEAERDRLAEALRETTGALREATEDLDKTRIALDSSTRTVGWLVEQNERFRAELGLPTEGKP